MRRILYAAAVGALAIHSPAGRADEPTLVNVLSLPGESVDLTRLKKGETGGANVNRQGYFSDIYYDPNRDEWWGLSDRGPGGGFLSYETRVQRFDVKIGKDGKISRYGLEETIRFVDVDGKPFHRRSFSKIPFDGLNPLLLNGDVSVLGQAFDPEGFVIGPKGHFFVSDEYGPSVYEFDRGGRFIRAFEQPDNILPKLADGTFDFLNGRGVIATGRQDNRGYEGVAINPQGTKLYGILQDPLVNEGRGGQGRRSPNLRIVEFDTKTGKPGRQFAYVLDAFADINARDPSATPFVENDQGRSIGASSIIAINAHQFLVLERDNRGFGVDASLAASPPKPLHKRVYRIDISAATDVSGVSFAGSSVLPAGVVPVAKTLFLDILEALEDDGHPIPEKLEGLAIGPKLFQFPGWGGHFAMADRLILLGTDNDYSVTQIAPTPPATTTEQFDRCATVAGDVVTYFPDNIPLDQGCPAGFKLIPSYLMSFKGEVPGYVAPYPYGFDFGHDGGHPRGW